MPDTLPTDVDVPARLRALTAARGLTVQEAAEAAGLTRQHVSTLLSGRSPRPTVETVAKVLAALDATWADLDG